MPVCLVPEGATLDSLGDSKDVRGRVKLEVVFNNRWRGGVK